MEAHFLKNVLNREKAAVDSPIFKQSGALYELAQPPQVPTFSLNSKKNENNFLFIKTIYVLSSFCSSDWPPSRVTNKPIKKHEFISATFSIVCPFTFNETSRSFFF